MVAPLSITGFRGANKTLDPLLLALDVGVESLNQRPGYGDLRAWKEPLLVATITATDPGTIFRMGADLASDSNYWLTWTGLVHATRGFEPDDTTERTYYTGDGIPKYTDNTIGLSGGSLPSAFRNLGLPAPINAPTVGVATAGTGTTMEDWRYTQTFVNTKGEEGKPGPLSAIVSTYPTGAIINVGSLEAPPANYNIDRRRIYKVKSGAISTGLLFLRELPVATTTTTDDGRATQDAIATTNYDVPPTNGKYITKMWNGILGMADGRDMRPSVPFKGYAYPRAWAVPLPETIKGLAVYGSTMIALTSNDVYAISGSDPETLAAEPLKTQQGLAGERAYTALPSGVAWASNTGLHFYGQGGYVFVTAKTFSKEVWQSMSPSTMVFYQYQSKLIVAYESGGGYAAFMVDTAQPDSIYYQSTGYKTIFHDNLSGSLYMCTGNQIFKFDAGVNPITATWKSKDMRQPRAINMAAGQVVARQYPVTVTVWADGVVKLNRSVTSDRPFRLKNGFEAHSWQVQLQTASGSAQILRLAPAMADLKE